MATLMTWTNSQGVKGRCDAKCHNAKTSPAKCDCMCGGHFHGAARGGRLETILDTRGKEILRQARAKAHAQGYALVPYDRQLNLPGL